MRNKKGISQIFIVVVCIAAAIIGLGMRVKESKDSKDGELPPEREHDEIVEVVNTESTEEFYPYNYAQQDLPDTENLSDDEMYSENAKKLPVIYFTSTELLDQCSMPLEVQAALVSNTQDYLNAAGYKDVTELAIDNDSFIDNDEKVAFRCAMGNHKEQLQITYIKNESRLYFAFVEDMENEDTET